VQLLFPPDRTVIHNLPAAPFHFPNPLSISLKIHTPLASIGRHIAQKSYTAMNSYFVLKNNDRFNRIELRENDKREGYAWRRYFLGNY
jgi:hypothetical protein